MGIPNKRVVFAAVVFAVLGVAGTAWSQDAATAIKDRQASMKAQGKDLGAIKAYLDGKAGLAPAQAAGADLVTRVAKIPELFPPKTSSVEFPDKTEAKPEIWSDAAKFAAAQKNALAKVEALDAALKGGTKGAIAAAFAGVIKGGLFNPGNGCGGCHATFRLKKS